MWSGDQEEPLIFQAASQIDPRLTEFVQQVEAEEIGLRVVSVNTYSLPAVDLRAQVQIQRARPYNVLEEFFMRAVSELRPPPDRAELAAWLGLDRLFVDATYRELERLGLMSVTEDGHIILTPGGQRHYKEGQIPVPLKAQTLEFTYLPVTDELAVAPDGKAVQWTCPPLPGTDQSDPAEGEATAIGIVCDLERVIQATEAASLGLHMPGMGQTIAGIADPSIVGQYSVYYAVMLLQDTVSSAHEQDNILIRVIDLRSQKRSWSLEQVLDKWLQAKRITLESLLAAEGEPAALSLDQVLAPEPMPTADEVHLAPTLYRQQVALARQRQQADEIELSVSEPLPQQGTVELLRDLEIRPRFLESLQNAQHTVYIISPWMTEQVLDDEFIDLLQALALRGVIVLMGWGISDRREEEERAPSRALLDKLESISSRNNVPAVIPWWIGNQHSKDVLVDHEIHMSGSHNWLSYRGDRLPRGESTYYLTMPEPVQKAANYVEGLFAGVAHTAWQTAGSRRSLKRDELQRCCVTLSATRRPQEAVENLLDLAKRRAAQAPLCIDLLQSVCWTMSRLPAKMLTKMDAIDMLTKNMPALVSRAKYANSPGLDQSLNQLGQAVKQLWIQYGDRQLDKLVQTMASQRKVYEEIGLLLPGQDAEEASLQLIGDQPRTLSETERTQNKSE